MFIFIYIITGLIGLIFGGAQGLLVALFLTFVAQMVLGLALTFLFYRKPD